MAVFVLDAGALIALERGDRYLWTTLGWASYPAATDRDQSSIRELAGFVVQTLNVGGRVALGFECPLWVPIPDEPSQLGSKRDDERDRAWSAGGGAYSLTTGLAQVAWILGQIRHEVPHVEAFLDSEDFQRASSGLFLWEAFVTGVAKAGSHTICSWPQPVLGPWRAMS